jgi:hypothetical protein
MRLVSCGWLAVLLLLLACSPNGVPAAGPPVHDEARTVIRRAIQAAGGKHLLTRCLATHTRTIFRYESPSELELTAESLVQAGGRPRRFVYLARPGSGVAQETVVVLDGKNSWRSQDGKVEDLPESLRNLLGPVGHTDRVASLVPLLSEPRFLLTLFAGGMVNDRPTQGVKVSLKGAPDVDLQFDKASGLLVKYSSRFKQGDKDVVWQMMMHDHRDLSSLHDAKVLHSAGVAGDDRTLLDLLRRQVPDPARLARVAGLVARLGDDTFAVREKAEADLIELGPLALPALRKVFKDKDLEVRRRARRAALRIEKTGGRAVTTAAIGQLARRRTAGAVKLLLAVLPGAEPALASDIRAALAALAQRDGKPDPDLIAALADKDPTRRTAAITVLGKDGGAWLKLPGRKLFVTGPLSPTKITNSTDGIVRTVEVVEVIYYNRLDDKLFDRPAK